MDFTRAFEAEVVDVDKDDRTIKAIINTDEVDRLGTIIDGRGARFDNYRAAGGPVLWEHGKDVRHGTDPIAKNQWIKKDGKKNVRILAQKRFLTDDFSQRRYELYRDGTLRGFSIRFIPDEGEWGPPTRDELKERPDLQRLSDMWAESEGKRGFIVRSWDLAEYSGTAVPGNARCVTMERACQLLSLCEGERSLWLPDDVKEELKARTTSSSLGGMVNGGGTVKPTQKGDKEPDPDDSDEAEEGEEEDKAKRYIKEEGGKYDVYSEKGKRLGSYGSKGAAEHRLKQIEYFKHEDKGRSAPFVDTDGVAWWVDDGKGHRVLSFSDPALAEECLRAMAGPPDGYRSFEYRRLESRARAEKFKIEATKDIQDYIDLYRWGKI